MIGYAAEVLFPAAPDKVLDAVVERWQRLIDIETLRIHDAARRRPDILALTRDALSLPEYPHTRAIVEFALIARLRRLYSLAPTLSEVERLRRSWEELETSFSGRQRRRARKGWAPRDHFLIDVASLTGHVWRAPDTKSFEAYCDSFALSPLGVNQGSRGFGDGAWPELFGTLPPFNAILRKSFGTPLGVPGLDDVLGSMLPTFTGEHGSPGIVNLIAGPPGSGKTTLCLTIASVLAELGSVVRFMAAEESIAAVYNKIVGQSLLTPSILWSRWASDVRDFQGDFELVEVDAFDSFGAIVRRVEAELTQGGSLQLRDSIAPPVFRQVLVIDSLSALLGPRERRDQRGSNIRASLRELLQRMRDTGVCLFLACSAADESDLQVDYLVDNVIRVGFESDKSGRHMTRILTVDKTRMQYSQRGRHVLHIAEGEGCSVSPSLHSVIRGIKAHRVHEPSMANFFRLPVSEPDEESRYSNALYEGSHVLLYGRGSTGKAGLAIACALAASISSDDAEQKQSVELPRTLILSFLYTESYYRRIVHRYERREPGLSHADTTVWALYPGYIDGETLVARIQKYLDSAEMEGRPYRAVVIDGIHNLLLEYPLLQNDELLWPCIFRILRANRIRAISTFTFFDVDGADLGLGRGKLSETSQSMGERSDLFFHMLVSGCDYSFEVQRQSPNRRGSRIGVTVANSLSDDLRVGQRFFWVRDRMALVPNDPLAPASSDAAKQ